MILSFEWDNTSGCSVKVWPYFNIFCFFNPMRSPRVSLYLLCLHIFFFHLSSIHSQNHRSPMLDSIKSRLSSVVCRGRFSVSCLDRIWTVFFSFRQFSVTHTTWWTSTQSLKFDIYLCQNHRWDVGVNSVTSR